MLREKATLFWLFLMPIVFFYFIGTVTSGFGGGPVGPGSTRLVLEGPPGDGVVGVLLERLEESGFRITRETPTSGSVRTLQIPDDFEQRVTAGQPVVLEYAGATDDLQADYDMFRLQRTVYTMLADVMVLKKEESEINASQFEEFGQRPRRLSLDIRTAGQDRRIPTGFEQAIPGILVMFTLLVVLTSGASLLIIEREKGLLRRLASAPISRSQLVLGKWLGRMFLAAIQMAFAMLTGTVLFEMNWGHDLGMILVVLFFWGAFCASFGLLLGSVARTQGQAVGIGVLTANILGALGGCWWPIEITPSWMQTLQKALPSGWTMDALHQLVSFRAGWSSGLTAVVLLGIGALLLGSLATRAFRYQ